MYSLCQMQLIELRCWSPNACLAMAKSSFSRVSTACIAPFSTCLAHLPSFCNLVTFCGSQGVTRGLVSSPFLGTVSSSPLHILVLGGSLRATRASIAEACPYGFLFVGGLEDLEAAHQRLVDAHHGSRVVEFTAIVRRGE